MVNLNSEFVIKDFAVGKTKKGDPMGILNLENCESGEALNCKIWDNDLRDIHEKTFRTGNIIRIIDGEYSPEYKNCIVRCIKVVKEAPIGLSSDKIEKLFSNILTVVSGFKDVTLSTAITSLIQENVNLFKTSPAAKTMHHAYVGGLMQHIWECIEFTKAVFPLCRQDVNHETVLAACILHDIGKMFEYTIDLESGLVTYNDEFQKEWISHTQYGFCWAMNNGFKELARIIAAHHGRAEWGALIDLDDKSQKPEPVLYLIHHIDDLSAKFGAVSIDILEKETV